MVRTSAACPRASQEIRRQGDQDLISCKALVGERWRSQLAELNTCKTSGRPEAVALFCGLLAGWIDRECFDLDQPVGVDERGDADGGSCGLDGVGGGIEHLAVG